MWGSDFFVLQRAPTYLFWWLTIFIGNHFPAWASFSFLTVIHLNIFKILTFPYIDAPPLRLELHPTKPILSTSLVRMHFLQLTYQTPQLSTTVTVEGWFFPLRKAEREPAHCQYPYLQRDTYHVSLVWEKIQILNPNWIRISHHF